ncbi:MAG: ABC transporter permease [Nitrospinae bacterium]|nr:ABC transporter permease [Nitrospinota bacterium]
MIISILERIGNRFINFLKRMGSMVIFFSSAISLAVKPPLKPSHVIKQINFIGVKSLFVIILTGLFTGMALGLQGYYTLSRVGSEALLGYAVAIGMLRELGPVLSALMVTGRAGSSMAAEIGIMRISEQIDALDTMAINPIKYIVVPKIIGGIIAVPLLTAIFDIIGILGGYLVGVELMGVNPGTFFGEMESRVAFKDVNLGFVKSVSFGAIVSWVSCFEGYYTGFGAEGVSKATTVSVVLSSVLILICNYFITSVML